MADEAAAAARRRVEDGLEALRAGLAPYVEKHMRAAPRATRPPIRSTSRRC